MRIARDLGNVSLLLPDGIDHLGDCPYPLHGAICSALRILDYEEFPIDERPPRRIWLDNDRLNAWWKEVERKRKVKYGDPAASDPVVGDEPEDDDYASPVSQRNAVELITRG